MKIFNTIYVGSLAIGAAFSWVPTIGSLPMFRADDSISGGCKASQESRTIEETSHMLAASMAGKDSSTMEFGGVELPLMPTPDCSGCVVKNQVTEYYCELVQGSDCDGWIWYEESYYWRRTKYLMECGSPGNYTYYVYCGPWSIPDCCNNGNTGPPPNGCFWSPGIEACVLEDPDPD